MSEAQINTELRNTKNIMSELMSCIKAGKMEYYKEYLEISAYYLKLSKQKPSHNLYIV